MFICINFIYNQIFQYFSQYVFILINIYKNQLIRFLVTANLPTSFFAVLFFNFNQFLINFSGFLNYKFVSFLRWNGCVYIN